MSSEFDELWDAIADLRAQLSHQPAAASPPVTIEDLDADPDADGNDERIDPYADDQAFRSFVHNTLRPLIRPRTDTGEYYWCAEWASHPVLAHTFRVAYDSWVPLGPHDNTDLVAQNIGWMDRVLFPLRDLMTAETSPIKACRHRHHPETDVQDRPI